MGESFTIQISSDLVRHLLNDSEKAKKKTKKPKPKFDQEPPQVTHDNSKLPKGLPSIGWPIPPPPPPPPPQKPENAELDAIWSALQASERVVERLQKQEENMLNEVTQRAKELRDKEFNLPNRTPVPCLVEREACVRCYKENMKDPLKCAHLVESFAECARMVRQQVGKENN